MIDAVGYSALVLNLLSMAMKNVFYLRSFSALANGIYVLYGIFLGALPLIIGCSIAVIIHLYHLSRLKSQNTTNNTKNE